MRRLPRIPEPLIKTITKGILQAIDNSTDKMLTTSDIPRLARATHASDYEVSVVLATLSPPEGTPLRMVLCEKERVCREHISQEWEASNTRRREALTDVGRQEWERSVEVKWVRAAGGVTEASTAYMHETRP